MTEIKRSNPQGFEVMLAGLKEFDQVVGKAGWFESAVYEGGQPVAYIAAVQEFGAVINHPGGTPYEVGPGGARFVTKAEGAGLPVTKPHTIVIPPRPFMRPAVTKNKEQWTELLRKGGQQVVKGTRDAYSVMELVALRAAGDIAKAIQAVTTPPLAKGTVAARRRQMSNKKKVGNLTKPLIASGVMFQSVTGKAERVP